MIQFCTRLRIKEILPGGANIQQSALITNSLFWMPWRKSALQVGKNCSSLLLAIMGYCYACWQFALLHWGTQAVLCICPPPPQPCPGHVVSISFFIMDKDNLLLLLLKKKTFVLQNFQGGKVFFPDGILILLHLCKGGEGRDDFPPSSHCSALLQQGILWHS